MHAIIPWGLLAFAPVTAGTTSTPPSSPSPATSAPTLAPTSPAPVPTPVTTSVPEAPSENPAPTTPTATEPAPVTTSPPPTPAPAIAPAPAPTLGVGVTTSAATGPVPAPAPAPSRFVPKNEAKRMAEGEVDGGKAKWKPGAGLSVETKDKRFSLLFQTFVQLQMNMHHIPGTPGTDGMPGSADKNDFDLVFRRARVWFQGNVFSPNIKYRITLTFSPIELGYKNGTITRSPILDWFFTFDKIRDATFVVGQYKVPYNHQRMAKIAELQFVDRSSANNEFTMDRDIGFDIRSKDIGGLGYLRYYAGMYLGDGIALYGPSDFGLAYLARVEFLPFGQYDDLTESDLERSLKPRMLIGGAYSYIDRDPHDTHAFAGNIPADGGKTTTHNATADISFKYAGFALESGFFFRQGKRIPGTNLDAGGMPIPIVAPRNGLAWFVQGGYLLPRIPVEIGMRGGQIKARGDATQTSLLNQNEVGGMLNYFVYRHALKLQLDYFHFWNTDVKLGTDQVRLQLGVTF